MGKFSLTTKVISKPFDQALRDLKKDNYEIISLTENSYLRIINDHDSNVSREGNFTKEGIIYIPDKGNYLVRESPILASAKAATTAHKNLKEFNPTMKSIEIALEDSIKLPDKGAEILVKDFKRNEITAFAFGEHAEEYGHFLRRYGIKSMPFFVFAEDYNIKQHKPFARQIWFGSLDNSSDLVGFGRSLSSPENRVCGIKHHKQVA